MAGSPSSQHQKKHGLKRPHCALAPQPTLELSGLTLGSRPSGKVLYVPRFPRSLVGIWGIWGSSPAESHIWIPLALRVPSWLRRMYSMPEELLDCGLAARTGYQSGVAAGPGGGASWALHHRATAQPPVAPGWSRGLSAGTPQRGCKRASQTVGCSPGRPAASD